MARRAGDGLAAPTCPGFPEVETTVRGLTPGARRAWPGGRRPRRADLRHAFPVDLRQRLTGATVTGLGRRAKYGLDRDRSWRHIRFPSRHVGALAGRSRRDRQARSSGDRDRCRAPRWHSTTHAALGSVDLVPTDQVDAFPAFAALGPRAAFGPELSTADYLARRFSWPDCREIEGLAARSADRRRARQYLCLRGA